MTEKLVKVRNKLGIHARPAALFVQLASRYTSDVFLELGDERINGKSIMGVMMLAAGANTIVKIIADGHDENEAIDALEKLFNEGFGEEYA
ncbi:MAG: HPr family phosphocarrier protein [Spirochaetes bacterium]|nr:HPr family phosphocarrier protein [Spirochaetota bacterium]